MPRLIGFFVLAWLLAMLLGQLPVVGPWFARTGCLGIWVAAMLLSWALSRWGQRVVQRRRDASAMRSLLAVDSPHGHGKLGAMFLAQGHAKRALPHLEQATAGEPELAEWHYRLGMARLQLGLPGPAEAALRAALALDAEHGYGGAQMRLAEALGRSRQPAEALLALEDLERSYGPSPESAYRRGQALKQLKRPAEALAAFAEVSHLAQQTARYQHKASTLWVWKAKLASML